MSRLPSRLTSSLLALSLFVGAAPTFAGTKEVAGAHVREAKAALAAGDARAAAKAVRKAKSALRARQAVQEAIAEVEALLSSCTTDAECEARFGKEP